jgi:spore coat protein A
MSLPLVPVWSHDDAGKQMRSPTLQKFVDPLPRARSGLSLSGRLDGSLLYDMPVQSFRQRLHRDLPPTLLWGYAGQFPGPTFDVRRGQRIFVRWRSELADPGFLIPQAFDPHLHGTHRGEPMTKTVTHLHGAVVAPF